MCFFAAMSQTSPSCFNNLRALGGPIVVVKNRTAQGACS